MVEERKALLERVKQKANELTDELHRHDLYHRHLHTDLGQAWTKFMVAGANAVRDADGALLIKVLEGMDKGIELIPAVAEAEELYDRRSRR
jgi:hypothetical protein